MSVCIKSINASNPRPSTSVPATGAVDVDIEIEVYGGSAHLWPLRGEVTLVPNPDACSRVRLVPWRTPEDWMEIDFLRRLQGAFEDDLDEVVGRIVRTAREAAAQIT